jgi:hypothetical protein
MPYRTEKQAINAARNQAIEKQTVYYVFYDPDEYGNYNIGDEYDADTFFAGIDPIYSIEINGQIGG